MKTRVNKATNSNVNHGFADVLRKHKSEIGEKKKKEVDRQKQVEEEKGERNKRLQGEVVSLLQRVNKTLGKSANDAGFQKYMCKRLENRGSIYQCHSGLFFSLPQVRTTRISKDEEKKISAGFLSPETESVVAVLETNAFTRCVNVRFVLFSELGSSRKDESVELDDVPIHHRDSFTPWLVFAKKCKNLFGTCKDLAETKFVLVNVLWEQGSGGYSFEEIDDFDTVNMNKLRDIADGLSKSRESFFETILKYLDD